MDPNQLAQVEALCRALYGSASGDLHKEAQQQLLTLQSSADFIPQCRFILDNSQEPFAHLVATQCLLHIATTYWTSFSVDVKMDLRQSLLNFLWTHANTLTDFVSGAVTKLVCRITKLAWFDSAKAREINAEISKFLDGSIEHNLIGLKLLTTLVIEMNTPTAGKTMTAHRKVAVSFRDQGLLPIFQIVITTLTNLRAATSPQMPPKEAKLVYASLSLSAECLAFDFIGTNPEESAEDVGTVQAPSAWKPLLQDPLTMQLFFDYYQVTEPPSSNMALQTLVSLSSVRRSLFSVEKERAAFLQSIMGGIQGIMASKKGLEHEQNYHEFCRLLGRLKANYQLSELVKIVGFGDWLDLACDFTVRSLQNWQYSMNSIHYLLALWGRLVAAMPYLKNDDSDSQRQVQTLRRNTLTVVQAYFKTVLESVDVVVASDGDISDPLEDEGSLREQMDRLPVITRLQYDTVAQYLLTTFEQSLGMYDQIVRTPNPNSQQLLVLEGRMTWLTYIIAAVIDAPYANDSRKQQTDLLWDGRLSRCVFQLVQILDFRLSATDGQAKCDEKLEIALMTFFKSFKKVYLLESSYNSSSSGISNTYNVPGGSPAHPLLSLALSSFGGGSGGTGEEARDQEVVTVYDAIGLGDMIQIMNIVINKLCNNIKFWHKTDTVLEETLEVFVELVTSYSSSKTLLGLDTVNFLVHNHVGAHFPFLGYDNDNKYRIKFYSALSRLVFSSSEDINNSFDSFVRPNLEILAQLSAASDLRTANVRTAIIGAMRDLRGITVSAYSKRTYGLLFEALHPTYFPLFLRIAQVWYDDPIVMTALFKFMQEFVLNKGQRIFFENSSADGILLFREASAIIAAYGSCILQVPVQRDIYVEKYKGIRLMLNTLTNSLSGGYVNFGVFRLYGDPALQNALDVTLQLCLQIPTSDIMAYVKLSRAYFSYLEVLFRGHLDVLCGLDASVFIGLLKTNQEGIQSGELSVSSQCASCIDHFATYVFLNQTKDKPPIQMIRNHISAAPDVLNELMNTLMTALLFSPNSNQWSITRPILSLMLANESCFTYYQNTLIASQTPENQEKLREEFAKLTTDIQRAVETTNRDRFTQKLTMFRMNVRQFLTL